MQPSDSFWDGVGRGISESPWWAVVGCILIIGVLFIVAKYVVPSRERIKMRELDIREREADNDLARIESNKALAEQTRAMSEQVGVLATQQAEQNARLNESASRSHEMGGTVAETNTITKRIDSTTQHTDDLVLDIHKRIVGGN